MKQITIISGKGGTGKTSITLALWQTAKNSAAVDCDVDASNMFLVAQPIESKTPEQIFKSGFLASIDKTKCIKCGKCVLKCGFEAMSINSEPQNKFPVINEILCEGCGACFLECPEKAIIMSEKETGKIFVSKTRFGTLIHARLNTGDGSSGKLVAKVRQTACEIAKNEKLEYIINDGPPGIGCPAIATLTGSNVVIIVTEPTPSGLHDMKRAAELCSHFKIKYSIIINKYDINEFVSAQIEKYSAEQNIQILGKIHYNQSFISALKQCRTIIEYAPDSKEAAEIKLIWSKIELL